MLDEPVHTVDKASAASHDNAGHGDISDKFGRRALQNMQTPSAMAFATGNTASRTSSELMLIILGSPSFKHRPLTFMTYSLSNGHAPPDLLFDLLRRHFADKNVVLTADVFDNSFIDLISGKL